MDFDCNGVKYDLLVFVGCCSCFGGVGVFFEEVEIINNCMVCFLGWILN